jgi:hypothetical protein
MLTLAFLIILALVLFAGALWLRSSTNKNTKELAKKSLDGINSKAKDFLG